jgi:hypothetical protein
MDDVEQFSRTLSAIAQSGAYSAKDIRQICAQEVQCCEEPILWADNIPYAAIRTPAVRVTVYERSSDIQIENRIYQNDDVLIANPTFEDIDPIIEKIKEFDRVVREVKSGEMD